MDPVRRVLLLLLLTSVVMTEPTQARTFGPERDVMSPTTAARWIHHLAVALRRTVQPATTTPPAWHKFRPALPGIAPIAAQVAAVHPAREAHAFRLPPPSRI